MTPVAIDTAPYLWTILGLVACWALTVLIAGLWLRSRGADIARLKGELCEERNPVRGLARARDRLVEKERLHAQPDLSAHARGPRPSDR